MSDRQIHPVVAAVKAHRGLVVLRGFDDDGPAVFWLLDMAGPELERWWVEQVEFWWPVNEETQRLFTIMDSILGEDHTALRLRDPMPLPGSFLKGESEEVWDFWKSLEGTHYYCHICCDDDSFLRAPDHRYVYHKGYTVDEDKERP